MLWDGERPGLLATEGSVKVVTNSSVGEGGSKSDCLNSQSDAENKTGGHEAIVTPITESQL